MRNPSLVIRLKDPCVREKPVVDNIIGELDPANFAKLVDIADLQANPRECKTGPITEAIIESLEENQQLFQHKTKGLLLASTSCTPLDRNRFRLEFSDNEIEGVLDGGHNLLATAIYMINMVGHLTDRAVPIIKTWEDLQPVWTHIREDIEDNLDEFEFFMPVEIKHAKSSDAGVEQFVGSILDISQARNNNRELALEAKSNKAGHYQYLKSALDPEITKQVEWKTNSGGRLKVRDIIALATIPLSRVKSDIPELRKIAPVMIYRNKGQCLKVYESLMSSDQISIQKGQIRELTHPEVKSALDLMRDLPSLFDEIYLRFPKAYNDVSPRFAGISSVRIYKPNTKDFDRKKHMKKPSKTRFNQIDSKYDYPEGFITPIVWALSELIESKNGKLKWVIDPRQYLKKHLPQLMNVYFGMIQLANYDPQGVGKNTASYSLMAELVKSSLRK